LCQVSLTGYIGIKFKVENKGQYSEYLNELEPLREELGIPLKEAMYPEDK
jgi:cytochrome c oxidase subunit 5a